MNIENLLRHFDPATGEIAGVSSIKRYLSDLRGCFGDAAAYEAALAGGNPLVYSVGAVEPAGGYGDLHYGVGRVMPGRIGCEYYMTKGHLHTWREAAEVYIGLSGEGMLLLEDELTGESRVVPLAAHGAIYVPGGTAHRTINTGRLPLTYVGVYPATAGHDYEVIANCNFRAVVVEQQGRPVMVERKKLRAELPA